MPDQERRKDNTVEQSQDDGTTERDGQGQSGYGAGRQDGERGHGNYGHPGHWTDDKTRTSDDSESPTGSDKPQRA